jgi:pimeloyl-ACP methyl ester carboxylesterase
MKPPERLTQRVTFRSGMIVVAATMLLALWSTSERVMALATLVATVVGVSAATQAAAEDNGTAIRPFRVNVPKADLADLRRRLAATRWPTKELVEDRSQGVQLATLKELVHYWATDYDWGKAEAKLNAFPQFVTKIDGVDVHFIHVKSRHSNAMPLIMTHGWPGSVIELLETVGPLTDPTSHGGTAGDAFHLVLPSLPGYGFSSAPTQLGWESGRIARAWAELMRRLGYTRYVAQGGDVGASVTDAMGRQAPEGLIGIHLSLLAGALGIADQLPAKSEQERAAHNALATFRTSGFGYFLEQSTRPQTIGYSLLDSPVGLAAWLLDHDTDSYYKISRAFVDRKPVGNLTRDTIVDNITLYWMTGTGASAADGTGSSDSFWPQPVRPAQLLRRSRFPSASRRSPARSGLPRAAGLRQSTPASPTSTRSTAADTSQHGKNRHSSRRSCARLSSRCGRAWSGGRRETLGPRVGRRRTISKQGEVEAFAFTFG